MVSRQDELLVPPFRFGIVEIGLTRGAFPRPRNLRFLKRLHLKTVLSLTPRSLLEMSQGKKEEIKNKKKAKNESEHKTPLDLEQSYSKQSLDFFAEHKVKMLHIEVPPLQDEDDLPLEHHHIRKGLEILIDKRNHPIYVHCLDGADVTALLIAALRLLMTWTSASIAAEVSRYLRGAEFSRDQIEFLSKFKGPVSLPHVEHKKSAQPDEKEDVFPKWLWYSWKGDKAAFTHPFITLIGQSPSRPKIEAAIIQADGEHTMGLQKQDRQMEQPDTVAVEAATSNGSEAIAQNEQGPMKNALGDILHGGQKGRGIEESEEDEMKFSQTIEALNLEGL